MHNLVDTSWSRVLIGGMTIVAGAFLAIALNAWWQDRQDGIEEQRILQAVKVEFTSIHTVLTQHLAEQARTRESLENLLQIIEHGPSKNAGPIIDSALLEMTSLDTWDRDDSVLDALLSTGRIRNLSNNTLGARLSAWEGVISEYWGDQEIANMMVAESHIPYFVGKSISVGAVMREPNDDRRTPEISISNNPDAIRQLLKDPKFHVLAEVRYNFKGHLIVEIETSIAAAEAILAEIEISLNSPSVYGR
jgi:hypothetical protein